MKVIVTLLIESDNGCLIPHSSLICRDWQWHGGQNKSRIANLVALDPWVQPHGLEDAIAASVS